MYYIEDQISDYNNNYNDNNPALVSFIDSEVNYTYN